MCLLQPRLIVYKSIDTLGRVKALLCNLSRKSSRNVVPTQVARKIAKCNLLYSSL